MALARYSGVLLLRTVSLAAFGGYACTGGDSSPTQVQLPVSNTPQPTSLSFTAQPTNTEVGVAIRPPVAVSVRDAFGAIVVDATNSVTIALGAHPLGANLSGTTTVAATSGIAVFSDLRVEQAGGGLTLVASAAGLAGATSQQFNVIAPQPATFSSISAGFAHACAVTTVGSAYCWGGGTDGELGNGQYQFSVNTPTLVTGGLSFAAISAGGYHTCGVTTAGTLRCWGDNSYGQLGIGVLTPSRSSTPFVPNTSFAFVTVVAGLKHSCAITTIGAAYCWGDNGLGELGNGSFTQSTAPAPVSGSLTLSSISAGGIGNSLTLPTEGAQTCGIAAGAAAYCWGDNTWGGQIGDGTFVPRDHPVAVATGLHFTKITAGRHHTCAITSAGAGYCWGNNDSGDLGNGSLNGSSLPVSVVGSLSFASISAGYDHTCALTATGAAYCWGDDSYGQLGNGTFTSSTVPTAVSGGLTFANISAGASFTCGVTTDGAAYCWGSNFFGELGIGSYSNRATPVRVIPP